VLRDNAAGDGACHTTQAEQSMELTNDTTREKTQSLTETLREGIKSLGESAPLRRISLGTSMLGGGGGGGGGGPLLQPSPAPPAASAHQVGWCTAMQKLRIVTLRFGTGATEKFDLNDGQIPNSLGVRATIMSILIGGRRETAP
jgi:hypothetical protein